MTGRFKVHQFFPDDFRETVGEDLSAEDAVAMAKRLTESLGGRLGTTRRVIITDAEDFTCFEWQHGKGVVFPTKETPVSREGHLAWAKARALEYLPEKPDVAASSFTSDLTKHIDTAGRAGEAGIALALLLGRDFDPDKQAERVRRYIDGFE